MPGPILTESIALELGAQEPWPNDVKLYQPYEMEQILLPDSANCLAVQAFLKMCNLDFAIEPRANAEFMSPSGKVPFIKCGAYVISELEPIVQFVGSKGISLTEQLDQTQKTDMRAYMSLVNNVLGNAELYICWCDKETYNTVTKPRYGSVFPWPLNHIQTYTKQSAVVNRMKALGWYKKTIENVYEDVENCCHSLSERLEGKDYFFGSQPCELDALVYGHMVAVLTTHLTKNNVIFKIINSFQILTDYTCNIHQYIKNSKPRMNSSFRLTIQDVSTENIHCLYSEFQEPVNVDQEKSEEIKQKSETNQSGDLIEIYD